MYLAAHSLGTSNFTALRKQVLLSALSQRKFISVSSGKRKVSMEEKSLYGRDVPVCVYSKDLEESLDLQLSSR